jgi:hypothetical protein
MSNRQVQLKLVRFDQLIQSQQEGSRVGAAGDRDYDVRF